jgi:hypothetical protein
MLRTTVLVTAFITVLLVGAAIAPITGVTAQHPESSSNRFLEWSAFGLGQDQTYQPDNLASTLTCPLDMISYWKLDEITGSTFVDSAGSNDGQCTGNMCPLPDEGVLNGGQHFLGSQGIDVPASTDFNWDSSSDFSIEVWVNIPEAETCAGSVVFVGRHAGTRAWWVGCDQGSNWAVFSLRDSAGNAKEISGGVALNDGEWHHVVAVHDGANNLVQLYVDGDLAESETTNFTGHWISQEEINFGYYNILYVSPDYYFTGTLDEIAVYGRALSPEEIAYHYAKIVQGKGYCEPVALEVETEGPGSVNVTPAEPYLFGQAVTLTAEPNPGYIFFEWDNDLTGAVNPATLIMDGDKKVTARFSDPVYYTLLVDANGLGVVNIEPDEDQYLHGSLITLQAVPEPGWLFSSWSGDLAGNQSPVELLVTTDLVITANFIEEVYQLFLPLIRK